MEEKNLYILTDGDDHHLMISDELEEVKQRFDWHVKQAPGEAYMVARFVKMPGDKEYRFLSVITNNGGY